MQIINSNFHTNKNMKNKITSLTNNQEDAEVIQSSEINPPVLTSSLMEGTV